MYICQNDKIYYIPNPSVCSSPNPIALFSVFLSVDHIIDYTECNTTHTIKMRLEYL